MKRYFLCAFLAACGPTSAAPAVDAADSDGFNSHLGADASVMTDSFVCEMPPPAGTDVQLAPPFDTTYRAFALGVVPGVPNPLGGAVVASADRDTLLIAGSSETSDGGIYSIRVRRSCGGHIVAFEGTATRVADAPYVDANLVYGAQDLLLFTGWPEYSLGQLPAGAPAPSQTTDLRTLGIVTMDDSGPGGLGFVPPGLASAGELRLVTWPAGHWYHVGATFGGSAYTIDSLATNVTVPNNPGGFAYVPAGSQNFPNQSIIVAEWSQTDSTKDRVVVYEVDGAGDPQLPTRREFFAKFPRPWGAYFEPVTGDYIFLTWGAGDDRVYIVQGFVPPPS
jgi:hypothetical protein